MRSHHSVRSSFIAAMTLMLVACGKDTTATPTVNAHVFLSATPQPAAATSVTQSADRPVAARRSASTGISSTGISSAVTGGISADAVDSIMVDVFGVAGIQPTDTADYAAALNVNATAPGVPLHVNFRSLSQTTAGAIEIANGRLPAGSYGGFRLRFLRATITFNTTVTARGVTYDPGTSYPLEMTHGITYAADAPANRFVITNGPQTTRIDITFDVYGSVATLQTSPTTGNLLMNPIFVAMTRTN